LFLQKQKRNEGDKLHQLVDCIILGPYSTADLNSNIHVLNVKPLPVPQYHSRQPDLWQFSQQFSSSG
jgi:hypothetical protein